MLSDVRPDGSSVRRFDSTSLGGKVDKPIRLLR